jgi:hypothetical protein
MILALEWMSSPHKRIRLVEFVAQIPTSPSGKVLRRLGLSARRREVRPAPAV